MRRLGVLTGMLMVASAGVWLSSATTHAQPDAKDAGLRRITTTGTGTVAVQPDAVRVSVALRSALDTAKETAADLDRRGTSLERELAALKIAGLSVKKGPLNLLDGAGNIGFGGNIGGFAGQPGGGLPPRPGGAGIVGGPPQTEMSRTYTVVIQPGQADVKGLVAAADRVLVTALVAGATQQPAYNPSQSGFFGGGNHQTNSRVELYRTDPAAARHEALKLAVADAQANARAVAGAVNLTVKDIVTLTDQPANGAGLGIGFGGGGGPQRPEVHGEYDLTVTVSVTYTY